MKLRKPPGGTGPKRAQAAVPPPVSTAFHAVSVQCGKRACDGIRLLAGQRFLSRDAPRLPLPDCTSGNCGCRYLHHANRRDPDTDDLGREIPRGFDGEPASPAQPDRRQPGAEDPASARNGPYDGWLFLTR